LQVQHVVLGTEQDGPRPRRACPLQRFHPAAVVVDDRHAQPPGAIEQVGLGVLLDDHNLLSRLEQRLHDPEAQVTQADEHQMAIERRGDGHFPLLAPRAAVEEQRAEVGQPGGQDAQPQHGHDEVEQLQRPSVGKLLVRLEER